MAETIQYSELLNKASEEIDAVRRMCLIGAFALSQGSVVERLYKPFNPLLGETFEMIRFV